MWSKHTMEYYSDETLTHYYNTDEHIAITQMNRYHLTVMKTLLLSEISPDTNGQILHDFINIRYLELRESFLKQVDKSRGPQGERGLGFSTKKKGQIFFPSIFLRIM